MGLQQAFGNQKGHIDILNALFLKFLVHNVLDVFPDGITVRSINENALDGRIVDQLGFCADIGKPLGKVLLHIGDLLYLFIFCHSFYPLCFSHCSYYIL